MYIYMCYLFNVPNDITLEKVAISSVRRRLLPQTCHSPSAADAAAAAAAAGAAAAGAAAAAAADAAGAAAASGATGGTWKRA